MKKLWLMLLTLIMAIMPLSCASGERFGGDFENYYYENLEIIVEDDVAITNDYMVEYGEYYYSAEEVALYLYVFAELPYNYITKNEAMDLGWESRKGNLWEVAEGACIGGDRFGNYEGLLPKANGRQYYECDVDYEGGFRDAKRIIFSNDGLIFYTEDHYESFIQLFDGWYELYDAEAAA